MPSSYTQGKLHTLADKIYTNDINVCIIYRSDVNKIHFAAIIMIQTLL